MKDKKKPCDDIFEGLAELLINNGKVTAKCYTSDRRYNRGECKRFCSTERWTVNYGDFVYFIDVTDGEIATIQRVRLSIESEVE